MRMACKLLRAQLPASCQFRDPAGGYFIWITFPAHIDGDELNAFARERHQVSAISGHVFSAVGANRNCIRLSIAFHRIDRLEEALRKFARAATEFLDSKQSS